MKKILLPLLVLFVTMVAGNAQVLAHGDIDYCIHHTRFRLEMDELRNNGDAKTDNLRFKVWASEYPWDYNHRGYQVAVAGLPRLQAHQSRYNVHNTTHLHYPHTDWYFITVTIEERVVQAKPKQTTWEIRDVISFYDQIFLVDPDEYYYHWWW